MKKISETRSTVQIEQDDPEEVEDKDTGINYSESKPRAGAYLSKDYVKDEVEIEKEAAIEEVKVESSKPRTLVPEKVSLEKYLS